MKKESIGVFILFIISGTILCFSMFYSQKKEIEKEQIILENFDVQFTGSIINKETKKRGGRTSTIICVNINYSNRISFSMLDKKHYLFLKIKDGIASLVIPSIYNDLDSISINMNNNRMQQYYLKGKLIAEYPLSLSYAYLNKQDLEFCFR